MSKKRSKYSVLQAAAGLQPVTAPAKKRPTKKKVRKDVKLLHRLYDVESNKKVIYPIPELITELLCTINMFEGTDVAHCDPLVTKLRDVHLDLKNLIAVHPDYQDNAGLKKLDAAYQAAGWDDNGLRWTKENPGNPDEVEDVFIVEFVPGTKHTEWRLA